MPVLRRSVFGDLYIRVVTQVPTSLSKRQKEILEEFNVIESNKPDPVIKSFFEKAKNFLKKTGNTCFGKCRLLSPPRSQMSRRYTIPIYIYIIYRDA